MVSSGISASGNTAAAKDSSLNFSTKTESNSLDFNKLMTKSISLNFANSSTKINTSNAKTETVSESALKKADDSNNNVDDKVSDKTLSKASKKVSDKASDTKTENNSNTDAAKAKKADAANYTQGSKKTDEMLSETDKNKIDDALTEIKDEIKKTFGMTDEELENALSALGITLQDLLQPKNLTDFVCEITGTSDALTLLTDSSLSENLKSLMNFTDAKLSTLANEMNISLDDLKAYIESAVNSKTEATVDQTQSQISIEENPDFIKTQSENVPKTIAVENEVANTKTDGSTLESVDDDLLKTVQSKLEISDEAKGDDSSSENNAQSGKNNNQSTNNIANNLTQNIQTSFNSIIAEESASINAADVIKQIVEAAKITLTEGISSMEMQLNPQNLGKINLLVVAKDGMITAQITAENETVKKAIESQIGVLKENFINQGLKVEAVEVTIASHAFEGNQNLNKGDSEQESQNKKSGKGFKMNSLDDLHEDELSDEEKRVVQLLRDNNSNVEYSA